MFKKLLLPLGLLALVAMPGMATAEHHILGDAEVLHGGLVQVYTECGGTSGNTPDTTHNAPLSAPACSFQPTGPGVARQIGGGQMALGTTTKADPIAQGEFTILVRPDDPFTPAYDADVVLKVHAKDVNCRPDATLAGCGNTPPPNKSVSVDYNPAAAANVPDGTFVALIRITDANCVVAGQHCTTVDLPFSARMFCTPTPTRPDVGSTCEVATTANAAVPGVIPPNSVQSNTQVFRIRAFDNGADGVYANATGDDRLALQQGIWIP